MATILFDELNKTYGSFDDVIEVLQLLEDISEDLNAIFKDSLIKNSFQKTSLYDYDEFIAAFEQAKSRLNESIFFYRLNLNNSDNHHCTKTLMDLLYVLNDIGFTGVALNAKKEWYYRILIFFKDKGRKTAAQLLNVLLTVNTILGSLAVAIPAVHGLEEMKKMSESALKVNELVPDEDNSGNDIIPTGDFEVETEEDTTAKFTRKGGSFDL